MRPKPLMPTRTAMFPRSPRGGLPSSLARCPRRPCYRPTPAPRLRNRRDHAHTRVWWARAPGRRIQTPFAVWLRSAHAGGGDRPRSSSPTRRSADRRRTRIWIRNPGSADPRAVERSSVTAPHDSPSSTSRRQPALHAAFVAGGLAFGELAQRQRRMAQPERGRLAQRLWQRLERADAASRRAASSCRCAARLVRTRFAWSAFASRFASARISATTLRSSSAEHGVDDSRRERGSPRSPPIPSRTRARARAVATRSRTSSRRADGAEERRRRRASACGPRGAASAAPSASRRRGTRRAGRRRGSTGVRRRGRADGRAADARASRTPASRERSRVRAPCPRRAAGSASRGRTPAPRRCGSPRARGARASSANARRAAADEREVEVERDAPAAAEVHAAGRVEERRDLGEPVAAARRRDRGELGARRRRRASRELTARRLRAPSSRRLSATPAAP